MSKSSKTLRVLLILWGVFSILLVAYEFIDTWYLLKRFTLFVGIGPYLLLWTALVSFTLAWIIGRLRGTPDKKEPSQEGLGSDDS